MKFVEPSVELITNLTSVQQIELAARTCYKSESVIDSESAIPFVQNKLIKTNHHAMLEFATATFMVNHTAFDEIKFANFKYLNLTDCNQNYIVSGNIRAWRDFIKNGDCSKELRELFLYRFKNSSEYEPLFYDIDWNREVKQVFGTEYNIDFLNNDSLVEDEEKKVHTYYHFRIVTSRGVTHELVRHRPCSYAQESTRYVNYKSGIEFVYPAWYYKKPNTKLDKFKFKYNLFKWKLGCKLSEIMYKSFLRSKMRPEQARDMLMHSAKVEINILTNEQEYDIIFKLRSALSAHPDIRLVSNMMKTFIKE